MNPPTETRDTRSGRTLWLVGRWKRNGLHVTRWATPDGVVQVESRRRPLVVDDSDEGGPDHAA